MKELLPRVGAAVVTSDGHLLGHVSVVAGDCFKVDMPMEPDEWFGFDVIQAIDDDVRLSMTRNEIEGPPQGIEHLGFHVHRET